MNIFMISARRDLLIENYFLVARAASVSEGILICEFQIKCPAYHNLLECLIRCLAEAADLNHI
jgi:hypothetical protein